MYISNGITADAGWTKQIAWGTDGVNWSTLNKLNLTVVGNRINKNTDSVLVSKATNYLIVIYDGDLEQLRFSLDQIDNQPSWTSTPAGLQQAIDDISTWIAT